MADHHTAEIKRYRFGSVTRKAVMLVLANYCDAEWSAFAGQARIAGEAEVGERTVRRVLADFEREGLIRREHRYRKDGTRTSDRTVIVIDAVRALPAAMTASEADGSAEGDERRDYRPLTTGLPATHDRTTGQSLAGELSVELSVGSPPGGGADAPAPALDAQQHTHDPPRLVDVPPPRPSNGNSAHSEATTQAVAAYVAGWHEGDHSSGPRRARPRQNALGAIGRVARTALDEFDREDVLAVMRAMGRAGDDAGAFDRVWAIYTAEVG